MPRLTDPTETINKIMSEWTDIEAEAGGNNPDPVVTPEPAEPVEANPDAKPTVQPSTEPEADPTIQPVTPDSLPPGTPGTTTDEAPDTEDDEDLDIPSPPGGDIWGYEPPQAPPEPQKVTLSDGTQMTLAEVEALIKQPQSPTQAVQPQPAPQPVQQPLVPQLPAFTDEDLENPALRAVIQIAAAQQQRLIDLDNRYNQIAQQTAQSQYRDNAEIVNSAISQFREQYRLPAELMDKVAERAGTLLPIEVERMAAQNNFNPYQAVVSSLNNAYWLIPEARQFEFERQAQHRQAALARQRRLNGVGGSSGSAPHVSPPPDNSKDGLYQSLVAEVAAAMEEGNE